MSQQTPIPEAVMAERGSATSDFEITGPDGLPRPESMWSLSPGAGITGLWVPYSKVMGVSDPPLAHHDDLYRGVTDSTDAQPPVIPWGAASVDGAWNVDLPTPGGSLWNVDLSDDILWRNAKQVPPSALWPVAYTCRYLGIPEDATITFGYEPPRAGMDAVEETLMIGQVYDELRFTPAGLPDPAVDRESTT